MMRRTGRYRTTLAILLAASAGIACERQPPAQHPSAPVEDPSAGRESGVTPAPCLPAAADEDAAPFPVFHNIETKVTFQKWNTAELGPVIERDLISVIKPATGSGDVVVLRHAGPGRLLRAEVYRATDGSTNEWQLISQGVDRRLKDQYNDRYLILEMIPGENGGRRTESFVLPRQRAR
jgi:hypothetical protein